ncbi:hypothetical protein LTR53_004937 [Teratosphaeriaceae sp. CCFEE 6253]|nr:hypothetical protein LTR53_004937 [Teratosphaeriaceae sp. CCFEE 6253]
MTDTIDAPPPYTASPGHDDLRTWPPPPCYLYANPPEHNKARGGVSEVDRLRNFLLHALSYDYGCSRLAGLTRRDRDHFSNLLKRVDAKPNYDLRVDTYLTLRERGDYLNRHIYDPCNGLRIAEDSVVAILRNFFEFQGVAKEPGALAFFKKYGGHTLAHKVYCDQFLVIPRLTPHEHIRAQLRRSGHLVVDPYLARLCGPASYHESGVCKLQDVSSLRNERLIKIVVGDGEHEPYYIQRTILESSSDYFKKALAHESQLGSDEPGTLSFPEDDLGAWEVLLYWLLKHGLPPLMHVPREFFTLPTGDFELLLVRCWAMGEKYCLPSFQDLMMTTLLKWVEICSTLDRATLEEAFSSTPPGCVMRLLAAADLALQISHESACASRSRAMINAVEGIRGCMGEVLNAVSEYYTRPIRPNASIAPSPDQKQQDWTKYMVAKDHEWCLECGCMRSRRTTIDEEHMQ